MCPQYIEVVFVGAKSSWNQNIAKQYSTLELFKRRLRLCPPLDQRSPETVSRFKRLQLEQDLCLSIFQSKADAIVRRRVIHCNSRKVLLETAQHCFIGIFR